MDVSEDGTVTGSIDVAGLDAVEPKTDEAKAQIDALKAQVASGGVAEEDAADADQVAAEESGDSDDADADADEDGLEALRAEAESLGVNVDGRWGAERLRAEIDAAKAG